MVNAGRFSCSDCMNSPIIPMKPPIDADRDELRLLAEFEQPLRAALPRASRCPDPALLSAAAAGVLPEDLGASVGAHLAVRRRELGTRLRHDLQENTVGRIGNANYTAIRSILNGVPSTRGSSNSRAARCPENTACAMMFGASASPIKRNDFSLPASRAGFKS